MGLLCPGQSVPVVGADSGVTGTISEPGGCALPEIPGTCAAGISSRTAGWIDDTKAAMAVDSGAPASGFSYPVAVGVADPEGMSDLICKTTKK